MMQNKHVMECINSSVDTLINFSLDAENNKCHEGRLIVTLADEAVARLISLYNAINENTNDIQHNKEGS